MRVPAQMARARSQPDIVVLQEIKIVDEGFPRHRDRGARLQCRDASARRAGTASPSSRKLPFDEVHRGLPGDDSDEQARLIEGVFSVEGGVVRVCGIYLPNGNPVETDKFAYKLELDGPAAHLRRGPAGARGAVRPARRLQHHSRRRSTRRTRRTGSGDALFQPESRGALARAAQPRPDRRACAP